MEKLYGRDLSGVEIAGTSSLVLRARIKNGLKALKALDPLIDTFYDQSHFQSVKFDWIQLLFLYGIKLDLKPQYDRICRSVRDNRKILGLNLELDVEIMRWCEKNDHDLMREIFLIATCQAVWHALRKYKLPADPIKRILCRYGNIPLTIKDCEAYSSYIQKGQRGRLMSGVEIFETPDVEGMKNGLQLIKSLTPIAMCFYDQHHFESCDFDWIQIAFFYGDRFQLTPSFNKIDIDQEYCLILPIELDLKIMQWCDKNDINLMREIYLIATCDAVLRVLTHYSLPTEEVQKIRNRCGEIPLTIEACEKRSEELKPPPLPALP